MATYLVRLATIVAILQFCYSLPEQGIWDITTDNSNVYAAVTKSMYNNSNIAVKIHCTSEKETTIRIGWILRYSPCAEEYIGTETDLNRLRSYYEYPGLDQISGKYKEAEFIRNKVDLVKTCTTTGEVIYLNDETDSLPSVVKLEYPTFANTTTLSSATQTAPTNTTKKKHTKRSRRELGAKGVNVTRPSAGQLSGRQYQNVVKTWRDGLYLYILKIEAANNAVKHKAEVNIGAKGPSGYLSAIEWPLLPFYGTMCIVYVIYGLVWLVLLACNWRDLLRIQFWIGGVIILGMLEKAVFFAEYETINNTGVSVRGAVVFAELVSCLKRTVARMLVIIVSLGFGIVKPRLGPMLHRVIGVGALYFILGSVEGCLRVLRPKGDTSNQVLLSSVPLAITDAFICWWRKGDMSNDILFAGIPLAVTDAAICYWVFTSLVQTTRTLRLRRNVVKLSLYRHFTNTLIFAVLASVAFMIWSLKMHKLAVCITDWKEIWVDDAYWHLLFSVVLLVIMILWRPTINNQRYAFSPLLDQAEDEIDEEEPTMNDAFEGMKMRGVKGQANGSPKQKDTKNKVEDDLKWIEENIPASVADTALPSLLDSDEEIMTTKFEMSKME